MSEDFEKRIETKLDTILIILNGNGKIGICAKVNMLWGWGVKVVGVTFVVVSGLLLKELWAHFF